MDTSIALAYTEKVREKRALDKRLKDLNAEIDEMQRALLDQFAAEDGLDRFTVNGMNLAPQRQLWASTADKQYDAACDALTKTGFGDLVQRRFNAQTLSAVVREMDDAGTPIPPEWEGVITITEKFVIGATEAKRN